MTKRRISTTVDQFLTLAAGGGGGGRRRASQIGRLGRGVPPLHGTVVAISGDGRGRACGRRHQPPSRRFCRSSRGLGAAPGEGNGGRGDAANAARAAAGTEASGIQCGPPALCRVPTECCRAGGASRKSRKAKEVAVLLLLAGFASASGLASTCMPATQCRREQGQRSIG